MHKLHREEEGWLAESAKTESFRHSGIQSSVADSEPTKDILIVHGGKVSTGILN